MNKEILKDLHVQMYQDYYSEGGFLTNAVNHTENEEWGLLDV